MCFGSNLWRGFLTCIVCVFSFTAIHTLNVRAGGLYGAVHVSRQSARRRVVCCYATYLFGGAQHDPPFQDTTFRSGRQLSWEIINFAILGVLMGVRGVHGPLRVDVLLYLLVD